MGRALQAAARDAPIRARRRSTAQLLVAQPRQGRYVYTGLAFFRQLPAGVPGAYRLFVNLLAAGA